MIPPDLPLEPHEHEVADWFEAAACTSSSTPPTSSGEALSFEGRERHYYEIMWNERRIWGATAAMIVNLSRRLPVELKLDAGKWRQKRGHEAPPRGARRRRRR